MGASTTILASLQSTVLCGGFLVIYFLPLYSSLNDPIWPYMTILFFKRVEPTK